MFDTTAAERAYSFVTTGGIIGNNFVGSVLLAAYEDYWKLDGINEFVITQKTGINKMYLNGVEIGSSIMKFGLLY